MKQPTVFQNIQTRIRVTTINYQKYLKLGKFIKYRVILKIDN